MSESLDKKPSGRRYAPLVLAASFIFAGLGICRTYDPGFFSDSSIGLICLVGAALALLGYAVGTLINLAKR
jgi:hypothetical protein